LLGVIGWVPEFDHVDDEDGDSEIGDGLFGLDSDNVEAEKEGSKKVQVGEEPGLVNKENSDPFNLMDTILAQDKTGVKGAEVDGLSSSLSPHGFQKKLEKKVVVFGVI
jgi:hypothetical protein